MELRSLRADITSLEAASGLTVDDILGIMQDLWGDVRHESGRAAEDNPVRDADELTSKLIWACNQLVKITERHADALSGVSRLSRLQEKLTALQTQADAYEAAGSKMEQLQAEETRLKTAVAGLRARQDELERRVREKTAEEKNLEQAASEADTELRRLEEQVRRWTAHSQEIDRKKAALEESRDALADKEAEYCRLEQEQTDLDARNAWLTTNVGNLQNAVQTLTRDITVLTGEKQQLTQQQAVLVQQQTDLDNDKAGLTPAVGNLRYTVQELMKQIADLTDEKQNLEQEREDLTRQHQDLDAEVTRLTTEVGRLRGANGEKSARRQELEDEHKAAQEEADRLSGYDEQLEELSRKLTQLREIVRKLREDTKYLEIRGDEKPFALEPSLTAGVKQSEKIIAALRKAVQDYRTDGCN